MSTHYVYQNRKEFENYMMEEWWFCASQVQVSDFMYLLNCFPNREKATTVYKKLCKL